MDNAAPQPRRLLSLSIDRLIFSEGSAVAARMAAYARDWDEVHIIVAAGTEYKERVIGTNVFVYPTRSRWKLFYPLAMARLGRFIVKRRGITMITCQDPFLTAMAGVRLKKETGIPLELQVHTDIGSPNFTYSLANRIRKALALSYLPKADHIRVVSDRIRAYLTDGLRIPADRIEVRPIPVDADAVRKAPVIPGADLHVTYPQFRKIALVAARFEPEKNIKLAIDAWHDVVKAAPDAGLIIVGSGSQGPSLRNRARGNKNIVFEPWVSREILYSYYKTADVFLTPSLYEGYGMAFIEAAAAGCPIVSTDVGVARDTGAVIVGFDAADFARGIKSALGVVLDS